MRRIILFAAACMAFAACSKEQTRQDNPSGAFEKGQKLTLTVSAPGQTKVSSSADATTGEVNFKWETGDKIKVSVGQESGEFTLKSGAGSSSGTFEGVMPADGNTFDVQFPVVDPDFTTQAYSSTEAFPHDMMKFTATNCSVGTTLTLTATNAALRLKLYGLNREVSRIVVTNTTANPNVSYTLNCGTAVRVGNSAATATPFCIVVPEGSWSFKVDVTSVVATKDPEEIPVYNEGLGFSGKGIIISNNTFSTSSAQAFAAGKVLDMPAKPITIIWAPVNCGYEAANGEYKGYTYGRMYQWGRKYGHGYNDSSYQDDDYPRTADIKAQTIVSISKTEELLTNHPDGADYNGNFYDVDFEPKNWYGGLNADKLWNTNEGTVNPVSKSGYDPCPDGWRVPTKVELEILKGTKPSLDIVGGTHGTSTVYGSKFDGGNGGSDNHVFLPIAGYITLGGTSSRRGSSIYYWSSTVDNGKSYMLVKGRMGGLMVSIDGRAFGCSVRCVKE